MRVRIKLVRRSEKRGPVAERIVLLPKLGLAKHFSRLRSWSPSQTPTRKVKVRLARASPKD